MNYQLQLQPVDLKPELKPELLEAMRQIYQHYTGSEVAEAIRAIRREIDEYREACELDDQIAELMQRKSSK